MELDNIIVEILSEIDFLSHTLNLPIEHQQVNNREEASEGIHSLEWELLCIDRLGDVYEYLMINHPEEFAYIDKIGTQVNDRIIPKVEAKLDELIEAGKINIYTKDRIIVNIANIAIYLTYSSMCSSQFFDMLYEVYLTGYIPCGWEGSFPRGKVKVY